MNLEIFKERYEVLTSTDISLVKIIEILAEEFSISNRASEAHIKNILMGSSEESVKVSNYKSENYKWNKELSVGEERIVGVIPDIHAPFHHPRAIEFLIKTFEENNVNTVVCLGDLVDQAAISLHLKNPEGIGANDEWNRAMNFLSDFKMVFKNLYYCIGNHDQSRLIKTAASAGIPERFLKGFAEIYDLPETWIIDKYHIIDNVLYKHGQDTSGRNSVSHLTSINHMSTVVGHQHTNSSLQYTNNGLTTKFGMVVGCLVDREAYAFKYGENHKFKPVLACGLVASEKEAYIIPYVELTN